MHFSKLRLHGFKSFVEPTEFAILPGLTGLIGPNGCGKSNLVEALRWVMGESSYKSMRASGMDDVIFAGGGSRPARNVAEVVLTLDNSARTAPSAFNDADVLEVSRRIEREGGSTYRLNGREVRARDIQILFADASTGSRSPALVRQGQIAEIISAKPQARRRVLEEAAGIAGLHVRRREAELRLKGAEDNLARIADVLAQVAGQGEGLRRQARQAQRYREVQAAIRKAEVLVELIAWDDAQREAAAAEAALAAAATVLIGHTRAQGEAARNQAIAAHALPALRDAEAAAAVALAEVVAARRMLEGEERRAHGARADARRRLGELTADLARQEAVLADADGMLARLATEVAEMPSGEDPVALDAMRSRLAAAADGRAAAEVSLAAAQAALAEADARQRSLAERLREDAARLDRTAAAAARANEAEAALRRSSETGEAALATGEREVAAAIKALTRAEAAAGEAEAALDAARIVEGAARGPLAEADRAMQRLDTELRTLEKIVGASTGRRWPAIADALTVARGFETAVAAALGEDLDASTDARSPAHWVEGAAPGDPALPAGATALLAEVEAPPQLHRRLAQIGLVSRVDGPVLRRQLAAGQRLVSREGDLWRWDGYTRAADAPSAAARRFAERNRLAELRVEASSTRDVHAARGAEAERAGTELRAAGTREAAARAAVRDARRRLDGTRDAYAKLVRTRADAGARLAPLAAAADAARAADREAIDRHAASEAALAEAKPRNALAAAFAAARGEAAKRRTAEAGAQAALQAAERTREAVARRRAALAAERASWQGRAERATAHVRDLADRRSAAERALAVIEAEPEHFVLGRRRILADLDAAEGAARGAADARVAGETALAEADRQARVAAEAMAAAREGRARAEALAEAAAQRLEGRVAAIAGAFACQPAALPALAGLLPAAARPQAAIVAARLESLRGDRDRIGPVNLRAEEELAAVETQGAELARERSDLAEAVRRLRGAIATLNREGRDRLLGAFAAVNGHFKELFATLFGGGAAELQLVEADDPLDAGLEISARPPGKTAQVMSLLSGGEQALAAISLIFAVFLTKPSPICVLDEVDAPLDDANVERFCDLVESMRTRTQTRFIAVTHNPITMARMDRLYGVTQAERGISQLVGVDLAEVKGLLATP